MEIDKNKAFEIVEIAKEAGKKILEIYDNKELFLVKELKADNSPLTLADKLAHKYIAEQLSSRYPTIPIFSEEGRAIPFDERKDWEYFWLVDPLDGTKEFINRNGEFTVNIALIHRNNPVFGVIYVPVTKEVFYGNIADKAYKITPEGKQSEISVSNKTGQYIAVKSKSHSTEDEERFFANYDVIDSISVGSSLKFTMIAEGKADIYYRSGPTCEWDTAAGHAIVTAAGGRVVDLQYNKTTVLNGSFAVFGY